MEMLKIDEMPHCVHATFEKMMECHNTIVLHVV